MNATTDTSWSDLVRQLELELEGLSRLVRLSHRQCHYLMRRDERRIHANVRAIDTTLADLRAANARRTGTLRNLGITERGRKGLKIATERADTPWRERVQALEVALARVMELLGHKNLQNYQLSRFSLDSVGEEMRLLLGASEDPGSTYDAGGAAGDPALRGAVDGRA
ncbi:MAG TPA: flagellar export chaperone FlgN [Candidatus Krumholzibacteria bacterium]|nr:flagellar export chaperone FlgN [Candidatus Krumholzibacteria bacterium]